MDSTANDLGDLRAAPVKKPATEPARVTVSLGKVAAEQLRCLSIVDGVSQSRLLATVVQWFRDRLRSGVELPPPLWLDVPERLNQSGPPRRWAAQHTFVLGDDLSSWVRQWARDTNARSTAEAVRTIVACYLGERLGPTHPAVVRARAALLEDMGSEWYDPVRTQPVETSTVGVAFDTGRPAIPVD